MLEFARQKFYFVNKGSIGFKHVENDDKLMERRLSKERKTLVTKYKKIDSKIYTSKNIFSIYNTNAFNRLDMYKVRAIFLCQL